MTKKDQHNTISGPPKRGWCDMRVQVYRGGVGSFGSWPLTSEPRGSLLETEWHAREVVLKPNSDQRINSRAKTIQFHFMQFRNISIPKPHRAVDAVVNIQGAGSPQKKVERIKPARIQPARCHSVTRRFNVLHLAEILFNVQLVIKLIKGL